MKTACIILLFGFCYGMVHGQKAKAGFALEQKTMDTLSFVVRQDSVLNNQYVFRGTSAFQKQAVPIPVAKPDGRTHYAMPIKKLSGKNLAPMPGTKPLDDNEIRFLDSTLTKPVDFKRRMIPAK